MGFEVRVIYHPRKEDGSYDTETKEEKTLKIGKSFEDTPIDKLALAIMGQLARRDIWVVDVSIDEFVRSSVSFKECKDGRGIVLKNKRYSFNAAAEIECDELFEEQQPVQFQYVPEGMQPHELVQMQQTQPQAPNGLQPHEIMRQKQSLDDLYGNPNKPVPVYKQNLKQPVNQKKVLYKVVYDPQFYEFEAKKMGLKFTVDQEYPVHQVIPHPGGRLDLQKLAVTDDRGRVVEVDEKYFMNAGQGLFLDKQLGFSGSNGRGVRKPKLAYEDEMVIDAPDPNAGRNIPQGIPIDDGSIPESLLEIPDIRAPRRGIR